VRTILVPKISLPPPVEHKSYRDKSLY